MKQESKVKRIFQAFTEESDLPQDIVDYRRNICATCPFNTKNIEDSNLTLLQRQKKIIDHFCVKCGCFIDKKTSRSSETCGLEDVGLKPKWTRILLKTTGNTDLNLKNLTHEICNLKISDLKENFELDLYSFKEFEKPIILEIIDEDVTEVTLKPYCDCVKVEVLGDNKFSIFLNTDTLIRDTNIMKTIEIDYTKQNKKYSCKILIKGKYEL